MQKRGNLIFQSKVRLQKKQKGLSQKGLTFIEVMIVIILLAGIAALVGPAMFGKVDEAKVKQARIQIESLGSSLELYRMDNSSFPDEDQGLEALIQQPEMGRETPNWRGPYLRAKTIPMDPWGFPYEYYTEGGKFVIRSLGSDQAEGGEGLDEDIYNK